MGLRLRSIRQKILLLVLVPVLSLIGLYIFATSIAARDAVNLARANTLKNATGVPVGVFLSTLDTERPLALVYLARPTAQNLAALQAAEARTNGAVTAMRSALKSQGTMGSASTPEKQAIAVLAAGTRTLPGLRSQIRSQVISRPQAFSDYNTLVEDGYQVLNEVIRQETNAAVVTNSLAFVRMGKSEEMLLRENALVVADMAAGTFPASDRLAVTELVGARRALASETLPDLDPAYRAIYTRDVSPQASAALTALENRLVSDTSTSRPPDVPPGQWDRAVGTVAAGMSAAGTEASTQLTSRSHSQAQSTYLTLFLAGGLGLLAVALSILVTVWVGRGLVRELAALRDAALDMANKRLPEVVRRLAAGQTVDVSAEAPELPPAHTKEIGEVGQAFAAVQQTAVQAAVGQARLRHGISDIFRNLARRSQSLLHRQLTLLDGMERRAREPEELEDLYRIDHLTTRMRRHAESLIILSGDSPARGWRRPVPFVDVLRAAVAEVEDYTRIKVTATTRAAITGPAVADVIHLVAELAENAVVFSPPNTPVLITGDVVGRGFAVEIEDRGLGLSEERRAELNELLDNPPPFDVSGSDQLGLFVAGQLAKKHGIRVSLRSSPYGGTTAIALIPVSLVASEDSYQEGGPDAGGERAVQLAGRHAARLDPASFGGLVEPSAAAGLTDDLDLPDGLDRAEPALGTASRWPADSAADVWTPAAPSSPATPRWDEEAAQPGGWLADASPSDLWPASASPASPGDLWPAGATPATPAMPGDDAWLAEADPDGPGPSDRRLNGFLAYRGEADWPPPAGAPGLGDQDNGAGPGHDEADDDADEATLLPRRVRQASLAPQLRDNPGWGRPAARRGPPADGGDDRSPEDARSTVTAIQQGSERGRSLFDAPPKTAATTVASADPADHASDPDDGPGAEHSDE